MPPPVRGRGGVRPHHGVRARARPPRQPAEAAPHRRVAPHPRVLLLRQPRRPGGGLLPPGDQRD